jgi:hypothetical protein
VENSFYCFSSAVLSCFWDTPSVLDFIHFDQTDSLPKKMGSDHRQQSADRLVSRRYRCRLDLAFETVRAVASGKGWFSPAIEAKVAAAIQGKTSAPVDLASRE